MKPSQRILIFGFVFVMFLGVCCSLTVFGTEGADGFGAGDPTGAGSTEVTAPTPKTPKPADGEEEEEEEEEEESRRIAQDLSPENFARIILGSSDDPNYDEGKVEKTAKDIREGKHPAQKLMDLLVDYQKDNVDSDENRRKNVLTAFRVALRKEPSDQEVADAMSLAKEKGISSVIEKLFNNNKCPWKEKYGKAEVEGGLAAKIAKVAAAFPTKYPVAQSFPYAPGTENGNLGCANVVSAALKEAGVKIPIILGCDGVCEALLKLPSPQTFKKVTPPPYKPGDVIIWAPGSGSGRHKHIGIVAKNGNSLQAMNNSSSKRHPSWQPIEYRPIETVLRAS